MLRRNVDRLFAIWQALNPTSYTINQPAGDGTFVITASSIENDTTPLAPFNDATGQTYWTSDGVRKTQTFNYAYPETQRWAFSSDADYTNSVQNAVNQLYGGVANQLAGDQGFNNFVAMPASTPAAPVIMQKESNGSAHEVTNGAQKPIAAASTAQTQKSGFHPIRSILGKTKNALSGDSNSGGDGTRELDLEAEIGKDNGKTPHFTLDLQTADASSANTFFQTLQVHRIYLQHQSPQAYPPPNLPRTHLPRPLRWLDLNLAHPRRLDRHVRRLR